jgi:hypothetical protein
VGKSQKENGVLVMQVNLEFLTVDRRTFVTDEDKSLQVLFGDSGDAASATQVEVQTIARRLVTLFASLKVRWGWEMQWLSKYLARGSGYLSLWRSISSLTILFWVMHDNLVLGDA